MSFWKKIFGLSGESSPPSIALSQPPPPIASSLPPSTPQQDKATEMVSWEGMPCIGKPFLMQQAEPLLEQNEEMFQQLGMSLSGTTLIFKPEDIVDRACAWNVPTFYVLEDKACCFLKANSLSQEVTSSLRDSIAQDRVTLTATFYGLRTFPIVALLLQVPISDRVIYLEAVPDLTQADIRDCLDILLKTGRGTFYFFTGEPPQLLAQGQFSVELINDLRKCLDQAATHYRSISLNELNYLAATQEYFRTTPL